MAPVRSPGEDQNSIRGSYRGRMYHIGIIVRLKVFSRAVPSCGHLPQTGQLKLQNVFFHSPGGWESEMKGPVCSVSGACRWQSSHCGLAWLFPLCMFADRPRLIESSLLSLLLRRLALSAQNPTHRTSFSLNCFLRGPSPNAGDVNLTLNFAGSADTQPTTWVQGVFCFS